MPNYGTVPAPGTDERRALIIRAWDLSTGHSGGQKHSTRQIAAQLDVSQQTAARLIREGIDAEAWVDLLDRAEARTAMAVRLVRHLERCERLLDAAMAAFDDDDRDGYTGPGPLEVMSTAIRIEDRLAKLLGLDVPARVLISGDGGGSGAPEPDPELAAAIRGLQASNADARAAAARAVNTTIENGDDDGRPDDDGERSR